MANYFKHSFVSAKSDGADATLIRPSNWNANHDIGIQLTNRTGGSLAAGDVVALSGANDESVILGDTLDSSQLYVVSQGAPANLAQGIFTQTGAVNALVAGATVRGNFLAKSATTKALYDTGIAASTGHPPIGAVGIALTGSAGAGLVVCHLFGHSRESAAFRQGATIASAAALNVPAGVFYAQVSGTTTITSIASRPAGTMISLMFQGVLLITHNATSLILQGGVNIATDAGTCLFFVSEGSGNWRQLAPSRERLIQLTTANNAGLFGRNAANTADLGMIQMDGANRIVLGDPGVAQIYFNNALRCDLSSTGRLVVPVGANKWAT